VARHDFKPLTILHVEDDDNDGVLLLKACEKAKLPVSVHRVINAEQAITYLRGEEHFADRLQFPVPQVLVLDLKLPTMTGIEFLNWLRTQSDFQRMPVLVFTSSLSRDDKSRALEAGASSYFVKPASFEALVQLVGGFQLPNVAGLS
jgi:DNA-binding response OmpR family regulator